MQAEKTLQNSVVDEPVTSPLSPVISPASYPLLRKSRSPEFYGFVAWLLTLVGFVLYIFWAVAREEYIEWIGVSWYPNRSVCIDLVDLD